MARFILFDGTSISCRLKSWLCKMNFYPIQRIPLLLTLLIVLGYLSLLAPPVDAVPMVNDPKGFEGIPWGAAFSETADFLLVENSPHIKGYELKQGPPPLGSAKVDSMRFLTLNGEFARVVIRYHGKAAHDQIVAYFQSRYGPLDQTPGQISKGLVQQLNWQGDESEISLTYESLNDRGIIFFEYRPSALKFSEGLMAPEPDHGGATY
ncbi:MAG: hypothetical protein ACHQWV_03570 [Nitrospirales bacterium]